MHESVIVRILGCSGMEFVIRWLIGLGIISLVVGWAGAAMTLRRLRRHIEPISEADRPPGVPEWITGFIERLFFTIAVAFDISGTAVAMVAWISVKMVTNTYRLTGKLSAPEGIVSLLASLVSILFALIGGLVIKALAPQP